jgi:hypothetical protein
MSTNQTFAQMHPGITGFQAFLAPLGARRHLSDLIKMPTGISHQVFPFLETHVSRLGNGHILSAFQATGAHLQFLLSIVVYHAIQRLSALLSYFQDLVNDPPIPGGCPILNTAIESDDAQPALRDRARAAMDELRSTIRRILAKGIERGEVRPGVDVETWASVMVATLEGAVMLSRLYQDPVHMQRAVAYVQHCIERDLV